MRVFDRWSALTRREQRLAVEAAARTLAYTLRVRVIGAPQLHRGTLALARTPPNADDVRDLATAVARASRYVPGATCLSRALALQRMLERRGLAADVRIGVQTSSGALRAHAWVECGEMTMNGPTDGDPFVVLR